MSEYDNTDASHDRGMPDVSNNEKPVFLLASCITALVLLGGYMIFQSLPRDLDEDQSTLVQEVEQPFDRERVTIAPEVDESSFLGHIDTETFIPKLAEPKAPVVQDTVPRLSEEEVYKRRRSPLVIYDKIKTDHRSQEGAEVSVQRQDSSEMIDQILDATSENQAQAAGDDHLQSRLKRSKTTTATANRLRNADTLIAQGTMINAVLETAISSDLPGMVRAVLTQGIYSEDGTNLILTKGSRVIGEYRAGIVRGQGRLFVVWHRIITPDGIDITIDSPGADPLGRSGHGGWIDTHFVERFGASFLLSMVGAAASQSSDSQIAEQLGDNLNSSAELALSSTLDIRPTLHKNQGESISIFVANDLSFQDVLMLGAK